MTSFQIPKNAEERLLVMKKSLESIGPVEAIVYNPQRSDEFDYSTEMFQIISDYQDASYALDVEDYLPRTLKECINECGRSKDGHNRSKYGERCNLDNSWWGGVFELDVNPASYWKNNDEIYTGFIEEWAQFYVEDPKIKSVIIDLQLRHFLSYNYTKILQFINLVV